MMVASTGIDIGTFIDNIRATKPPYECPFADCRRIYRSFAGIHAHLTNFKHEAVQVLPKEATSPTVAVSASSGDRRSLTWLQAQKIVEVEINGRMHLLNIFQPLEIIITDGEEQPAQKKTCHSAKEKEKDKDSSDNSQTQVYPEPSFSIVQEYSPRKIPPLSEAYIKFVEKLPEEMDLDVEYDMDEEDAAWLSLINERRQGKLMPKVSENTFEYLMDRLEKQSHFQTLNDDPPQLVDEDAVCCVCNDGECENSNVILFCDMCNLAVHQECYGVPYIPEGQWLCRRCQLSPSQAVDCCLCPNRGGAMKQTSDGRWAHVSCALWVPEVQFANTVFLEPIEGLDLIPSARWKLTCYLCRRKGVGACIQCHKPSCYVAFHVTCAQNADLYMKVEPVTSSDPEHGGTVSIRKTAFCSLHAPPDGEHDQSLQNTSHCDEKTSPHRKEEQRQLMRKSRSDYLSEKRISSPVILVPVIPKNRLEDIANKIKLAGKQEFISRLVVYWTLKRQSRFGVPLLRRLQVYSQNGRFQKGNEQNLEVRMQLYYWRRLRQDLEKARLLVELVRKREKRKLELISSVMSVIDLFLRPRILFLLKVVENLAKKDDLNIFAQPVSEEEVPGYHRIIKKPIDFGLMREKVLNFDCCSLVALEQDFLLMMSNCLKFNRKNPYYYKYALRMKEEGNEVLREAWDFYKRCGFAEDTGMHNGQPWISVDYFNDLVKLLKTDDSGVDESEEDAEDEIDETATQHRSKMVKRPKSDESVTGVNAVEESQPDFIPVSRNTRSSKADKSSASTSETPPDQEDNRPLSSLVRPTKGSASPATEASSSTVEGASKKDTAPEPQAFSVKRQRSGSEPVPEAGNGEVVVTETKASADAEQPTTSTAASTITTRRSSLQQSAASTAFSDANRAKYALNTMSNKDSFQRFRKGPTSPSTDSNSEDSATEKEELEVELLPKGRTKELVESIQLEPLDLVWAKCHNSPWFPGMVVDPRMHRSGLGSLSSLVPTPPENVVKKMNPRTPFLVILFDSLRSWHWLSRKNLMPLGIDFSFDKTKLNESDKAADRKAVGKAYELALRHRCQVTGESLPEMLTPRGDHSLTASD